MSFHEIVGTIHAHSIYSDGSGTVEEIVGAASKSGIDFLVLTDHNTLEAKDLGYEGWHEKLLLIVGDEVSSSKGHCLALGTMTHVNHRQSLVGILDDITQQGGHSYVAHPYGRYRPLLRVRDHSWQDWQADSMTGLELWSYMFDWVSKFHFSRFFKHYHDPDAQLSGPDPETIRKWDELCQYKRVVAFGGVDAHAKTSLLLPYVVFPYEKLFATIRTHLLAPRALKFSKDEDISTVHSTLASGRCFLAHDGLRCAKGTRFGSRDGDLIMGDEALFEESIPLESTVPAEAEITLLKDGHTVAVDRGTSMKYVADRPGVYRIEARLAGRPWIFTNPIYLRAHPPDPTHP